MIGFKIRSGTYSDPQLRGILRRYFPIEADLDLFIQAAIKTDQITTELGQYILPEIEPEILEKPILLEWVTYLYGSGGRIGIRADRRLFEKYGYPTEMYFTRAYINRKPITIDFFYFDRHWWYAPETPLRIVLPRRYEPWRMQIPTRIISKGKEYVLTVDTPIQTELISITKEYWTEVTLWGYQFDETLTFDYTKTAANERHLEMRGIKFVNEINSVFISEEISSIRLKIQKLMDDLLAETDQEYYNTIHSFEVTEGSTLKPSKKPFLLIPEVTFIDIDRGDLTLLKWIGRQSFDRIPPSTLDFELLDIKIKDRRVPGTKWWPNRGGFK